MRYRAINFSEASDRNKKAPVFLFSVFKKNNRIFNEISLLSGGSFLIIIKEVEGVFFCYYKSAKRVLGYQIPIKEQAYEIIVIPETHPLFNFKHATRNVPVDDESDEAQWTKTADLRAFSIKEGRKLQELYTKQEI